ncbi:MULTISPECIES: DUF4126 domain-containing protein [Spirulina sp. CCY15215]|uniref:DUF4126 domain-containing protein n=1 Tax=Spirulina sp. CCY15215 TaxID=2767591 RepID=UPI001EF199F0|nr:DUF4126 domain-containing protein [Spirulina major]
MIDFAIAMCLGIAFSAACGFRIFVPPLVMSIASLSGNLTLAPGFAWIGTYPALICFAIAALLEVSAYYLPVVDNFLDTLEIPAAIALGTAIAAANLGEVDPLLRWSLAAITGGGTAGAIESFTSVTRLDSTTNTGGLGNGILATLEVLSAITLSILALLLPLFAGVVVLLVLSLVFRQGRKPQRKYRI